MLCSRTLDRSQLEHHGKHDRQLSGTDSQYSRCHYISGHRMTPVPTLHLALGGFNINYRQPYGGVQHPRTRRQAAALVPIPTASSPLGDGIPRHIHNMTPSNYSSQSPGAIYWGSRV